MFAAPASWMALSDVDMFPGAPVPQAP
jgi:hypothetical protein